MTFDTRKQRMTHPTFASVVVCAMCHRLESRYYKNGSFFRSLRHLTPQWRRGGGTIFCNIKGKLCYFAQFCWHFSTFKLLLLREEHKCQWSWKKVSNTGHGKLILSFYLEKGLARCLCRVTLSGIVAYKYKSHIMQCDIHYSQKSVHATPYFTS